MVEGTAPSRAPRRPGVTAGRGAARYVAARRARTGVVVHGPAELFVLHRLEPARLPLCLMTRGGRGVRLRGHRAAKASGRRKGPCRRTSCAWRALRAARCFSSKRCFSEEATLKSPSSSLRRSGLSLESVGHTFSWGWRGGVGGGKVSKNKEGWKHTRHDKKRHSVLNVQRAR